jgi:two-component system sensor histidine kinase KdpD
MSDADEPLRPHPEALLAAASREGRGRLKVYLGMAPGVGKTYAMLESARRLKQGGIDVVVGLVETHGRAETQGLLDGLEMLPRRSVYYRGHLLQEFDLDAALARQPTLLLVDEFAHTNPPDSRHPKRWLDVEELLKAGIDVHTTLNIQHLESLNDVVARITGVRVQETIPDRVLERAEEVELADLTPAELTERLRQGKVYLPHVAGTALDRFFRPGNLTALRELALRRTAEQVDEEMVGYMQAHAIEGPWPAGERLMVCIGADGLGPAVVRHARRLSDQLGAPWVAVHIEPPGGIPAGKEAGRLAEALSLAESLQGRVERLTGTDAVGELLRYARRSNITQIVVGRSRAGRLRALLGRSLVQELVRRAEGISVHVVTPAEVPARPRARRAFRLPEAQPYALATAGVAAIVLLAHLVADLGSLANVSMLLLGVVLFSAVSHGVGAAVYTSLLAFTVYNFFFTEPRYTLHVRHWHELVALLVFLAVAVVTGTLAGRVRDQAQAGRSRMAALQVLYDFARRLGATVTIDELLHAIVLQTHRLTGQPAMILLPETGELIIRYAWPPDDALGTAEWAAARWAFVHGEPAGAGTGTLPSVSWQFRPVRTARGVVGVLGLAGEERDGNPDLARTLDAVLDQAAVAIERIAFAADAARVEAMAETERLRNALLSSVSHDLRTPLTSILGSVTTLRQGAARLDDPARDELLATIEEEAERLDRFVHNLLDMTRLESGALEVKRDWLDVGEVVGAAARRMAKRLGPQRLVRRIAADLPLLRGDFVLLETTLCNLIDNAAKHATGATAITIRAERRGDALVIEVIDDGVGIPPEHQPHLFDKFYRAGRGDVAPAGTGLGLAICKGLAEAMGGRIEVRSPVAHGRGTAFALAFPIEPQPATEAAELETPA